MWTAQFRTGARGIGLTFASVCAAALILPACTKQAPVAPPAEAAQSTDASSTRASELSWAREALQRNPTLEVIATDTNAGVFTIRLKDSGEVRVVKVSELAAVPVASLATPARTAAATPEAPPPEQPAAKSRTSPAATPAAPASTAATSQPGTSVPNYTIERADGQVKVSGPGVSIVSTGANTASATEGAAGQRSVEPIICEGRRMLHFDNRSIYVDGDAIVARGGCELYITNSRVAASGTGVIVGDAIVHIANSTIEGNAASFDASDDAKVYVRSSTFQGLPRRAERAVVQDQGGNQWR